MLAFRDHHRSHLRASAEYIALKHRLDGKPLADRSDYTEAEARFIRPVRSEFRLQTLSVRTRPVLPAARDKLPMRLPDDQ